MERGYIASAYAQDKYNSFEYTSDELNAYYDEHKDELDAFSFDYYLVAADKEEVTETVTDEETGEETEQTSEKVTDATMAAAKENADKLLTAAQSGADEAALSFSEAVTEVFGADASATEYTNTLGVNCLTYLPDEIGRAHV